MARYAIRHNDTIGKNEFGMLKLPKLKGHIKLTLHNCRTGKNEVVEGDNIITNAVADIFANNYLGAIDTGSLLPIYSKWFGGVLVYKDPHADTSDPTDYFIKGNNINELIAHAGDTAPSSAQIVAEDLKRGSPLSETNTGNSVTRVWEWGSSQGNGQISALSLCHKDVGNAGTGCTSSAFQAFQPWESIGSLSNVSTAIGSDNSILAQYDDYHGLMYGIGDVGDYRSGNVRQTTSKITVKISRLPFLKTGLFDTQSPIATGQRVFTVEASDTVFKCMPSYYFDEATKRLWLFTNVTGFNNLLPVWDRDDLSYIVIDCENETIVDEGVIHSDANDLAPTCICFPNSYDGLASAHLFYNVVVDDGYLYFPMNTTGNVAGTNYVVANFYVDGYKKIKIDSQATQLVFASFNDTQGLPRCSQKLGGLIVNDGRVINGGVGYTCASVLPITWNTAVAFVGMHATQRCKNVSSCIFPLTTAKSGSYSASRYLMANKLVNTTLFNLNSAVQKTTSKSMQVEYTLTEVSGND